MVSDNAKSSFDRLSTNHRQHNGFSTIEAVHSVAWLQMLNGVLNRRLDNRAVDKLFIALMVVIICISAYPIISGSMPAFRRGCCRAISTRPQSTPLKIKAVPPDPCQAQVRRHCFFVRTCIHSYRAHVKQVLKAQVDCQARPSDPANRMISRMSPRNRSSA